MANIAARWTAEPSVRLWLKGQDAKNMVDITFHATRAPRAPSPDARRNIVDDRDVRRLAAYALGDLMGEFGTVENDKDVGIEFDHSSGALVDASQDVAEPRQHIERAHDRKLGQRKDR